ncbi:MAG: bifunctional folylpolyglutamate synthase/dihydrofolate synthase [Clostridia bacterium]|nr:bifunctional folylpolyglutamate synthase/dihydrofolate synthase [Clostridia bacterium]
MNYIETLNYIHSLGNFSKEPTLDRIKAVLEVLDNPQNSFSAIHIAGTNGKGSVSAMLHCVFKTKGLKTGLFISPFILDFRERIQINGEFIPENELCNLAEIVINTGIKLTEFEFITAVAFLYFKNNECDIAIIETGLGGRLDATNVLTNLKASIITKIGLDHTAILGDTIEQIAREKCGIIKDAPVITSFNQPKEALTVLNEYNLIIPNIKKLKVIKSDIFGNQFLYDGYFYKTSLSGEYQIENALMVIETALKLGVSKEIIRKALENTFFPARMEVISKNPTVILDGAHNPDGANALAKAMQKYDGEITAIIGMCADKDCEKVLETTLCYCKRAVAVEIKDMPRSLKAEELCQMAQKYSTCEVAKDYNTALEKVRGEDIVFVFGSLYLASSIREKLKNFYKV